MANYCKKCGNTIDNKTKKCTGCGKQYFNITKRVIVLAVFCVVALSLVGLNVYQYVESKETVKQLNDKLNTSIEIREDLKKQRDDSDVELREKVLELSFWNKNAVIVTSAGSKYHRYDCYHLDDCTSFWIYNTEAAESRGYTPCLDCYSGKFTMS